jgi:penicillin amidase
MTPRQRKILIALIVPIVLIVIGAFFGNRYLQKQKLAPLPQIDGTVTLPELDAPVEVIRDAYGVPHIYASTEHDLFYAQGFVHAQDRFWQMDVQRHTARGRLTELVGDALLETDTFLQTLGWERVSRQELDLLDADSKATLQAYADGVNAYIEGRTKSELALEYTFLNIVNRNYQVRPWEVLDSLAWAKAMAWDLRGNIDTEIDRALLLKTLTPEQVDFLYPPYPEDLRPLIVNDLSGFTSQGNIASPSTPAYLPSLSSALQSVSADFALLDSLLGNGPESGAGSNSWAIAGALTDTGMPLLANDPHLGASAPMIWYQIGLHCQPKGPDCPLDMVGYSFVGAPQIVIGHNDRIAWGFTNVGPDVMDLYIEKINPDNPNQYEFEGEWVDMQIITETINVAGKEPVEVEVRITQHGPILTEQYGLEQLPEYGGLDLPEHYAIALSWTALQPGMTLQSVFKMGRATNFEEFRAAAKDFVAPSQNLLYADVDGNIGYQMPGLIPIRAGDIQGRYPAPGWTGEHEWLGLIPFEELPFVLNPAEGYIVTANNAVVGKDYPYHLADTWAYGYRAAAILRLIQNADGPISLADMQSMQSNTYNIKAAELLPYLMDIPLDDPALEETRALLADWNLQNDVDSQGAALFEAWWKHLMIAAFYDEMPPSEDPEIESPHPSGGTRWAEIIRLLVNDPDNVWWDDITTDEVEDRDTIFAIAFANAVDDLNKELGRDPAGWRWGDLHMIYFEHTVMSSFPLAPGIFNRGPIPNAGGTGIVNATNWETSEKDYRVEGTSYSFRMVVDLANLLNSTSIIPLGQSGHPASPHYDDLIDIMVRNESALPMLFDYEAVKANAEGILILQP